jgi:HlyD family secretion protein
MLLIVGVSTFLYFRGSGATEYVTATVDRGDIESSITATGNVNAVVMVQVGSQVSGNISAIYADFNTKVTKGQLVARIDPAPFQAKVDQAAASVESAKAAVASARAGVKKADSDIASAVANVATQQANVVHAKSAVSDAKIKNDRSQEMFKQGLIARQDADSMQAAIDQAVANENAAIAVANASASAVDSAKAQREAAQAQLAQAEAQVKQLSATLQQAQLDLSHTEIRAPVDGTVVSRNMDVGQTVAASFSAPVVFQIAQDLTKMQVDTNVDESDVGHVKLGQSANFTVDAYPGMTFPGRVAQIRQAPINVQNVITYDVVVQVDNPDLKLFPGMTANVRVVTGSAPQALRVPVAALRFHPVTATRTPGVGSSSGKKGSGRGSSSAAAQTLYALENGILKPVRVQLGLTDGNFVEVTKGLSEGQAIVVSAKATNNSKAPAAPAQGSPRRLGI